MQWILLTVISLSFALFSVILSQEWIVAPRTRRATIFLFVLGSLLNAAGTIVFEGIQKAGRPTFFYHLHAPGPVTLKLFLSGAGLAALCFMVCLFLYETRVQRIPIDGRLRWFLVRTAVVSLLLGAMLELGLFNLRHYELLGTDKPKQVFERGDYHLHGFYFNRASQKFTQYSLGPNGKYGLTIYPRGEKIRNLVLAFENGLPETTVRIGYTDEAFDFPMQISDLRLVRDVPRSFHIPLHTVGSSYRIEILFPELTEDSEAEFAMPSITINQTVPIEIIPTRLALLCGTLFFLLCFRPGSPLYSVRLNLKAPAQIAAILLLLALCGGWYIWTTFSSYSGSEDSFTEQKARLSENYAQYDRLVEALMAPRYSLLELPNKDILNAERPYDKTYRDYYNIPYRWDTALFNRYYYVYFGVVPAVTVLLPWRLVTGTFLELDYATLLFCLLGLFGIYGLYSRIVPQKFPQLPFLFYILGFLLLFTLLNLSWCLRRGLVYELAISSGFCFLIWGIFLIWRGCEFRASGRLQTAFLAAGGLCAALAVGCRPTLLLAFPLIPVMLWPAIRSRNLAAMAALLIPCLLVGALLMKYNYERFGSVFEFGIHYQLTEANESVSSFRTGISGTLLSVLAYLFTPFRIDMQFPFLHLSALKIPYNGFLLHDPESIGLFSFPVLWFLFLIGRFRVMLREKGLLAFSRICLLSGLLLCVACSLFSVTTRYLVDFSWLFGLPAVLVLFCCREYFAGKGMEHWISAAALVCVMVGGAILIGLSLTGEGGWFEQINPAYFNRLTWQYAFWL